MTEFRKHHILPKTYLKYFSQDGSGKGIVTLDYSSKTGRPELRNQGDKIFWKKYFYKDNRFQDNLAIEKIFARYIEPLYNSIIASIKIEKPIVVNETKLSLLKWLIYNKLRSPTYRKDFESKIKFYHSISTIFPSESKPLIEEISGDIIKYSKAYHMDYFVNQSLFERTVKNMVEGLIVKKWKVLVAPKRNKFWTSDNPGFSIFIDEFQKSNQVVPSKYFDKITSGSVHFYPLTLDYCLQMAPYCMGDSIELNLLTDVISFETIGREYCYRINTWTVMTACDFVIMDKSVIE